MEYIIQKTSEKTGIEPESLKQFILFGAVGGFGTLLNTAILWMLHSIGGMYYLLAAAIATEAAIISNFLGNQALTFKEQDNQKSLGRKFLLFQGVSLFTLVGTLVILWTLTTLFGVGYVLIWNLIAIIAMFMVNFVLNKRYTWGGAKVARRVVGVLALATIALFLITPVSAEVTVGQLGYHPDSSKQVVVYGQTASDSFAIKQGSDTVFTGTLESAACQGGQDCLVGDFTEFDEPGSYQVSTPYGSSSHFTIKNTVYSDLLGTLDPFWNAQKQRGSDFHPDLHGHLGDYFMDTADGSFLMEADQASVTLSRLGSAYRRNPEAVNEEQLSAIQRYADYLMTLQGTAVDKGQDGVRLDPQLIVQNAFVPGPTDRTELEVYDEGGSLVDTVPVHSLCTEGDSTDEECLEHAASFYKCQQGEVCLNMTYEGRTGALVQTDDLDVPRGWAYEFGCYFDVGDVDFSSSHNPCMIFSEDTDDAYTARAMLAMLQAYPALLDTGSGASAVLARAQATAEHLQGSVGDHAAYGAGLFLLYDYTGDEDYLVEAHGLRDQVSKDLKTGLTHSNEFYWEEYARHKDAMTEAGLEYSMSGQNAEEIFTGKLLFDRDNAISGEGVYVLGSTGFSHSRPILIEGVMAAKTADIVGVEQYPFITAIADDQLSWLTGQNRVQTGVSSGDLQSLSFIFGIGDNPDVFHSRLFMTTGYASGSDGSVIGARETDFAYKDGATLIPLDGRFEILGHELGTLGNEQGGEASTSTYDNSQSLAGHSIISGWINGAHDTDNDADGIWNYEDKIHSYTFTETTNEMVAAAVELAAYQDARYRGIEPHALVATSSTNSTPSAFGFINITSTPPGASVSIDGSATGEVTPALIEAATGSRSLTLSAPGYEDGAATVQVSDNETTSINITLEASEQTGNATLTITSTPVNATVLLDDASLGQSPLTITVSSGSHLISALADGYFLEERSVTLETGDNETISLELEEKPENGTSFESTSTDVPLVDGTYALRETDEGSFSVTLDSPGTVTWSVNGEAISSDTNVTRSDFSWAPGVLYSANSEPATVTARTDGDRKSWALSVDDTINPFFTGSLGADSADLQVYTDDEVFQFDSMSARISNADGIQTITLSESGHGGGETQWLASLDSDELSFGDNVLVSVTGVAGASTHAFTLDGKRSHYRQEPSSDTGSSAGSGGSAASVPTPFIPSLVYVVYGEDVIGINDSQTVTLDVRSFENPVGAVQVLISDVDGDNMTVDLEMTDGDGSYGTWSGDFTVDSPGEYVTEAVIARNRGNDRRTFDDVNATFYVVDSAVSGGEELGLVFATLDKTTVENGTPVVIRSDIRDSLGVVSAVAHIENNGGDAFDVELERVSGDASYGSYEGAFRVSEPGTTYVLAGITITNDNNSVTRSIEDRSVYVRPLMDVQTTGLSSAEGGLPSFGEALDHPLAPAMIGLAILVLAIIGMFAKEAVVGLFRR